MTTSLLWSLEMSPRTPAEPNVPVAAAALSVSRLVVPEVEEKGLRDAGMVVSKSCSLWSQHWRPYQPRQMHRLWTDRP